MRQFREEEITVQTTYHFVVVTARHEERADDHGIVSRSFVRRIPLPDVSVQLTFFLTIVFPIGVSSM